MCISFTMHFDITKSLMVAANRFTTWYTEEAIIIIGHCQLLLQGILRPKRACTLRDFLLLGHIFGQSFQLVLSGPFQSQNLNLLLI